MVFAVGDGLSEVHAVEVEPQGHGLVEGGQGADVEPASEGGLAEQHRPDEAQHRLDWRPV